MNIIKNIIISCSFTALFLVASTTPSVSLSLSDFMCETKGHAEGVLEDLVDLEKKWIKKWVDEISNFIDDDLTDTAYDEVIERLEEFDVNVRAALEKFWAKKYRPALKKMAKQLSVAEIDQTRAIGSFMDANNQVDTTRSFMTKEVEAHRRFRVSTLACQAETTSFLMNNADKFSAQVGKTIANTSLYKILGKEKSGALSAAAGLGSVETSDGPLTEHANKWTEYKKYFCDPAMNGGNAGCTGAPGLLPNKDLFLGDFLWGDKKTIDLKVVANRVLIDRMLHNIISPIALPIISGSVLENAAGDRTEAGQRLMLERRSFVARQQTIYNVLSRMIGLRAATNLKVISKPVASDIHLIREKAGVSAADAAGSPSYYEMMEAMTRDKFRQVDFTINLIEEPETLIREGVNLQALQLQQMDDIYKRNEELLLLLAADLSVDLDSIPMNNASEKKAN